MCGRYTIQHNKAQIAMRFAVNEVVEPISEGDSAEYQARYNICPTQPVPAVTVHATPAGQVRVLEPLRWGLIPSWAKESMIRERTAFNARAETVDEKGMFKHAFNRRRCLLPSDGFYEWMGTVTPKQPFHIHLKDGELFSFAGFWEEWISPDGSPVRSCAHITTVPNSLVAAIHDRMPVILRKEDEAMWLDPTVPGSAVKPLLVPYPSELMEALPVSRRVNDTTRDTPQMVEAIEV